MHQFGVALDIPAPAILPLAAGNDARLVCHFYTNSRHEKKVAEQIAEHGIEGFLPLYKKAHQWTKPQPSHFGTAA